MSPEQQASNVPLSAIVVAGTHSGVGKTSVTLGLIGALRSRGLTVQPFKVGPDFIDPLHHQHASGRPPRNLDGWMLTREVNLQRFARATADADVAVIEGVMGLFDGSEGKSDRGSTAEMAKLLGLPVLLVIDASAMARSAAALIHGFANFDPELRVAGVILNNVGGEDTRRHDPRRRRRGGTRSSARSPASTDLVVPERHLGLHLPHEARHDYVEQLAALIEEHVDLDQLLQASRIERLPAPPATRDDRSHDPRRCRPRRGVLLLLRRQPRTARASRRGTRRVLTDRRPAPRRPTTASTSAAATPSYTPPSSPTTTGTRDAIREFAAAGGPIYAECGGLMYLAEDARGRRREHPALRRPALRAPRCPHRSRSATSRSTRRGGLFGPGQTARGHLFHHSQITGEPTTARCYQLQTAAASRPKRATTSATSSRSYAHLHFASEPDLAVAFLERCQDFQTTS